MPRDGGAARAGARKRCQHLKRGGFARAIMAQKAKNLARLDGHAKCIKRGKAVEDLG